MRLTPRIEKRIQIHEPAGPAREGAAPPPRTRQSPSARNPCSSCALASSEVSAESGAVAARIAQIVTDLEKKSSLMPKIPLSWVVVSISLATRLGAGFSRALAEGS